MPFENLAGRLVEITYRSSFWDEPVRPVFRFWTRDGGRAEQIAAGPVVGAGIWTGRVPVGTRRIDVSPTNRPGLFAFRIERIRRLPWLVVLARGFATQPKRARSALLTRLIGWHPESDLNLAWATSAVPFARFARWRSRRTRDLDLGDLDAPRFDWSLAHPIEVVIGDGEAEPICRTLASLSAQVFPNWIATMSPTAGIVPNDPRIRCRAQRAEPLDPEGRLTLRIDAGDELAPGALAYVAEQAHRYPDCGLFYADTISADERGLMVPRLSPGWSPRLFDAQPPRDALVVVRDLKDWPSEDRHRFLREGRMRVSPSPTPADARPLRRLLVERRSRRDPENIVRPASATRQPSVSVIIPTRDHPALLRRAVESIRAHRNSAAPQIVIVDNGSTTEAARRLLAQFADSPGITCLSHLGAFNFSRMCNDGAAAAGGEVVVFLNDDTKVLTHDWLERLSALAMEPSVGAVGAKLTYPDGRLQHVGVVLGMGGSAGHFGAFAAIDDAGWADRHRSAHEVSAVTGACLAVARSKFEAVGGFDAEHLPVELSDVDLCLKLNARGWQTVLDPSVHLLHEESASRGGATLRRLGVYAAQRAVFVDRWRHLLRDDPFFHPGLSLYSFEPALA